MVAFVDDYMPVVTNAVVHNTFANEALNDGHIEQTGRCLSATADLTNRLCRYVQEGRETLDPLVEELPPDARAPACSRCAVRSARRQPPFSRRLSWRTGHRSHA